jgi:beta-lactamase class A
MDRVHREIARIASAVDAITGLCAIHVESGERISLNADKSFAMASTYKVAIVAQLLHLVDQGKLSLDQPVEIQRSDLGAGSGLVTEFLGYSGVHLSIRSLLGLTLRLSDNTASDILLRLAGGPDAVTSFIRAKGIVDLRVDRSTKQILTEYSGLLDQLPDAEWSIERFTSLASAVTESARRAAQEAYLADPRNRCNPAAMANLLVLLHRGEIISEQQRDLMVATMEICQTGPGRLKGMLPPKTVVAHKTGTLEGDVASVINDVGMIRLPDDRGHVAIAVYVQATRRSTAEYEGLIAHLSRCVFDYFTLVS